MNNLEDTFGKLRISERSQFAQEVEEADRLDEEEERRLRTELSPEDFEGSGMDNHKAMEIYIRSRVSLEIFDILETLTRFELIASKRLVPPHYYPEIFSLLKDKYNYVYFNDEDPKSLDYVIMYPEHFAHMVALTEIEYDLHYLIGTLMREGYSSVVKRILRVLSGYKLGNRQRELDRRERLDYYVIMSMYDQ